MRLILAGGGTAGSVMPLLAIYTEIRRRKPEANFLFVGTKKGKPEKVLLEGYNIKFTAIHGGKLRRYFDLRNLLDIFLILIGFIQSISIILRFKPDLVIGAGGFISVPIIWAAWLLRKKILIHQQDIKVSLSNILTMNLANRITVTFEESLGDFPAVKTIWTGNPVRSDIIKGDREKACQRFNLKPNLPLLLVMGGGTGSVSLNNIVNQSLTKLVEFCQIIHLTGLGKRVSGVDNENYQQFEFLKDRIGDVMAAADIVISRAGLSALTEFSTLGKSVILIPLPNSHQLKNADYFHQKKAAIIIYQENLSPQILVTKVRELIEDKSLALLLSDNIRKVMKHKAVNIITEEIINLVRK